MKNTRALNYKFKILATSFFAFAIIVLIFSQSIVAADTTNAPVCPAVEAYCIYDKTHGTVLAEKNIDVQLNTSTSAKVMSGLIFCQELSERLDETVTVTGEMIDMSSGYSMKLSAGEQIKIKDLLCGAICGSYNDAYYVLSHIVSGSVEEFVALMNKKAKELGTKSTNYTNPIGYPDNSAMLTTVWDTLKIAEAASDNSLYLEISSQIKHSVPKTNKSDERLFYNRNQLITRTGSGKNYFHSECQGLNAGYTGDAGGWCVITLAKDNGADFIIVALGGKESEDGVKIYSYEAIHSLLDWASEEYNTYTVFDMGEKVTEIEVTLTGIANTKASCIAESALEVYIPKKALSDGLLNYEISNKSSTLQAPVTKGDEVGVVRVIYDGTILGETRLILDSSHKANAIMVAINTLGSYTKSRAFIATLICFAILMSATYVYSRFKPKYFKNKKH